MRNLILKDLILNKKFLLLMGLLYILYMGLFFSRIDHPKEDTILITFLCFILPVMIYTRDDKFKAAVMSCSLPATRKQIILARYILGWLLMLISYVLAITAILVVPGHKLGATELFNARTIFLALALMTLYFSILMPLLIRFGMVGFFVFLISLQVLGVITLTLASKKMLNLDIKAWVAAINNAFMSLNARLGTPGYYAFLLAMMLLLSLGSFVCSVFIFKRKDL
jgi:ABC-type transport system involved in multi-copper enzyme maturation permease subunit